MPTELCALWLWMLSISWCFFAPPAPPQIRGPLRLASICFSFSQRLDESAPLTDPAENNQPSCTGSSKHQCLKTLTSFCTSLVFSSSSSQIRQQIDARSISIRHLIPTPTQSPQEALGKDLFSGCSQHNTSTSDLADCKGQEVDCLHWMVEQVARLFWFTKAA